MNVIKAIDIMKALPLDPESKEQVFSRYPDNMSKEERLVVDELAWKVYDAYFAIKLEEHTEQAMQQVRDGKMEFGEQFNTYIRSKTEEDINRWLQSGIETEDLAQVRKQLGQIVSRFAQ